MFSFLWNDEVGVGAIGNALGTVIIALCVLIIRSRKPIICYFKAIRIKKHKGPNFGVLVCSLQGDKSGNVSRLIRSNLDAANFESHPSWKPLKIESFPLSISSLNDGSEQASNEKAKKWLQETHYDVIVWGEYIEEAKTTVIKVMGIHGSAARPIELTAFVNPKQFTAIMAEAVSREVVELASCAYSDPTKVPIEVLREISKKTDSLLASNMSWFSRDEAKRVRFAINKLQTQICSKSASFEDWRRAEINARYLVGLSNPDINRTEWVDAVYDYARHALRKALIGLDKSNLQNAIALMNTAIEVINAEGEQATKAKYLAACRKWFLAIRGRDATGSFTVQTFDQAFSDFDRATKDAGKDLHFAYVASMYPEQFSQKVGLGPIRRNWINKIWAYTEKMEVDDHFLGFLIWQYAEAVGHKDRDKIKGGLCEDAVSFLRGYNSNRSNSYSFTSKQFSLAYLMLCEGLLDVHGLTVFIERLGVPDIVYDINTKIRIIYTDLPLLREERFYFCLNSQVIALANLSLAGINGDVMYYRQAEDIFATFWSEMSNFSAVRRRELVRQRVAALNNLAVKTEDVSLLDRSYSILNSEPLSEGHDQYLLGYIKYAKAEVLNRRSYNKKKTEFSEIRRELLKSALEHCDSAIRFKLSNREKVAADELSHEIKQLLQKI